jgi:hypothetical protein
MSPWTVGVEEEVMLLDPFAWSVANRNRREGGT